MTWLKLLIYGALVSSCMGYKILAILQEPAKSQYILVAKLVKEVAKRGHEVTFISPYFEQTPVKNLEVITLDSLQNATKGKSQSRFNLQELTPLGVAEYIMSISLTLTEHLLSSDKVQQLLKSETKFDAVILYHYLNEAALGISHHFKAPVILFSTMPLYAPESFLLSHPAPPSYVPNILTEYTGRMNFWQRLRHTFYDTSIIMYYLWEILPKYRDFVRQYIPGQPDLYDFINNASLLLINSHVSTNEALPQVPNAIEIGGFHIEEPKPLPEDLQKFLDESEHGVILFSMGSIVRSCDLPIEKRDALIKTFSKLKENVLMKWEDDKVPELPKNVKTMKWIPQSDILAHPKLKIFINHGGLLSTMESVYHAVPIIGIPTFVDQKMNLALAVSYKYAVEVPYEELSEEKLSRALDQVLKNLEYKNNIKTRSNIMRDRPMKPLDSALYWIEYVIRHQGAPHLRYPGMDLNWFQRNLLDVVGFVLLATLLPIFVLAAVFKKLFSQKSNKKSKKE